MLLRLLFRADASRKQSLLTPEEEDDVADGEDATLSGDGADDDGGSGRHRPTSAAFVSPLVHVCAVQVRCRPTTACTMPANFGTAASQQRQSTGNMLTPDSLHKCCSTITLTPSGRLGGTVHKSSAVSAVMP
jgi:hypothetical protein